MASDAFVRVDDGKFFIDGKPYTFIGTNICYGAILGNEGQARDRYFSYVLSPVDSETGLGGCNFWAWGGLVAPPHPFWLLWAPYTGGPAQEEQGLYSVFATDTSTLSVIRKAARLVQQKITPVRIKNRHYVGFYIHRPTAI